MAECKGCGKHIVWGITTDGKRIPLDFRPDVYRIIEGTGQPAESPTIERVQTIGVNHFCTCPNANDFSRSRKIGGTA